MHLNRYFCSKTDHIQFPEQYQEVVKETFDGKQTLPPTQISALKSTCKTERHEA